MAILSQKRKIGGLRETVIGALERRLQAAPDRDKRQRPDISEQATEALRNSETDYDRTLLEFLSLYANRLRRWMEQSINAMRNAFAAFADMHRAHFEAAPAVGETADASAVKGDLRILREWDRADKPTVISNI